MKKWTKEKALQVLKELTDEIDKLRSSKAFSTEHTIWVTKCLETFEDIFGLKSRYYLTFASFTWRMAPGTIFNTYGDYEGAIERENHKGYLKQLGTAKGLLIAASNYLSDRELEDVYSGKDTGEDASLVIKVINLAEQKLRKVIRDKPEKETLVQDAFESLLIGADIPYGREVDSIEYSSKTYKPDFSLPKIDLAVEIKLCNRPEREKELPEEINDDILAYQNKYPNLIFVVYDLGYIRDKDRFCSSFEEHENVTVRVVKH